MPRPLYDIDRSYLENAEEGPFYSGAIPERKISSKKEKFLGFEVNSTFGIPAGPLLNSRWTHLASRLGYDILTYKTIRGSEYPGWSLPNVIHVEGRDQIPSMEKKPVQALFEEPHDVSMIGITNSFGMPSRSQSYLTHDIKKANDDLLPGQLLIVSIVGSDHSSQEAFYQDFVDTALFAKQCGAKVIEANFSCPNVSGQEGQLYLAPEYVFQLSYKLVQALKETPLILKVGTFPDRNLLQKTLVAASMAGVQAISGINSLSLPVVDQNGLPALGKDRPTSGVCGNPIRSAALEFVRSAREVIDREKLDLTLVGVGGAMLPEHIEEFYESAHAVQSATGMMWDPLLAHKWHKTRENICVNRN